MNREQAERRRKNREIRRCKRYLLHYGNLPDAKQAALKNRFYVQASVWETALGKLINQRRNMKDENENTAQAVETQGQQQETTDASATAETTTQETETTTTEEKTEEPARTGAAGASPVAASTLASSVPPGTSNQNAVVIRRMVTYITADDDVSHGVPSAGLELAAIIAKVNDNGTVNLHCFAPDSAAALFKESVAFGTLA